MTPRLLAIAICHLKFTYDILGLGSTAIDEVLTVPRYPRADGKVQISHREIHTGGLTATALVAAARLGAKCAFAGVMGEDEDSQLILRQLRREKINVRHVVHDQRGHPVRAVIVVEPDRGTRTIFYQAQGMIGAHPRWPAREVIESSRVLFVDRFGMAGMIRAARIARQAGIPVVGDFETTDVPRFAELLRQVNHLIVPHVAATHLTGQANASTATRRFHEQGHEVAVVTCGQKGCYYQDQEMAKPAHFPAFRVKVIDTTGCGDVFHGAYAMALAKRLPLLERIRLATAAAALNAAHPGGQTGCPTRAELERFLK